MTYTIIINTKDNQELVFKHIKSFFAEPGRIKLFKEKWTSVENVTGIILHEERDLIDDACKEFAAALDKSTDELSGIEKQQAIINHVLHEESDMSRLSDDEESETMSEKIRIVFDGPPSHENGRLVEVENEHGKCISFGEWKQEGELWYLEFPNLESQIDAMRDFMALLYLGIQEGRDEAFEALDDKTKHLINEVWFERLEED